MEKFLGLYAFTRGLYLSFLICGLILLITNIYITQINVWYLYVISLFFASLISFKRYIYFGERFADAVYREFYVHKVTGNKKAQNK